MIVRLHTDLDWTLGAATLKFRLTAVPGLIIFNLDFFEFKLHIAGAKFYIMGFWGFGVLGFWGFYL